MFLAFFMKRGKGNVIFFREKKKQCFEHTILRTQSLKLSIFIVRLGIKSSDGEEEEGDESGEGGAQQGWRAVVGQAV